MAALVAARIFLPPPARWGELAPAVGACVRALEGASLGPYQVLRGEWSPDQCRISPTSDHLIVDATLTVSGEPTPAELCGLYPLEHNIVQVVAVTPLPAATSVRLERLDAATTREIARRLGILDRPPHVVRLRAERSGA